MFKRLMRIGAIASLVFFGGATVAQAGIPIPCTGESIVKVMDLANMPKARNGERLALVYKFKGCFSGEWVGYVGSSSAYLRLDERKLKLMMTLAGRKQLPPEPSRWQHPQELIWPGIWAAIIVFVVGGSLMNAVAGNNGAPEPASPSIPQHPAGRVASGGFGQRRKFG